MQRSAAEAIAKKSGALKHCTNLLAHIERYGSAEIKLGATGLVLPCKKGDAIHTLLQSVRFALIHEINSIEIVENARPFVAPYGASEAAGFDEPRREIKHVCTVCGKEYVPVSSLQKYCCPDCRKEGNRKYMREYWRAHHKKQN